MKIINKKFKISLSKDKLNFEAFTGVGLPFDTVCNNSDYPIVFSSKGEYKYHSNPIPILQSHDANKTVGTCTMNQTDTSLDAVMDITDTEVQVKVQSGEITGLSIGIVPRDGEFVTNDDLSYFLVTAAEVFELSVTPIPSFVDARINEAGGTKGDTQQTKITSDINTDDDSNEDDSNEDDEEIITMSRNLSKLHKKNQKALKKIKLEAKKKELQAQIENEKIKALKIQFSNNQKDLNQVLTYSSSSSPKNKKLSLINNILHHTNNNIQAPIKLGIVDTFANSKFKRFEGEDAGVIMDTPPAPEQTPLEKTPLPAPEIFNVFNVKKVNSLELLVPVTNYTKAAAKVEENALKPLANFTFKNENLKLKKIAVAINPTFETLQNPMKLAQEIEIYMMRDLSDAVTEYIMQEQDFAYIKSQTAPLSIESANKTTFPEYPNRGKGLLRSLDVGVYTNSRSVADIQMNKLIMRRNTFIPNKFVLSPPTYSNYIFNNFSSLETQKQEIIQNYQDLRTLGMDIITNDTLTVRPSQTTGVDDFPFILDSNKFGDIYVLDDISIQYVPTYNLENAFPGVIMTGGYNGEDLRHNRITLVAEVTIGFAIRNYKAAMYIGSEYLYKQLLGIRQ